MLSQMQESVITLSALCAFLLLVTLKVVEIIDWEWIYVISTTLVPILVIPIWAMICEGIKIMQKKKDDDEQV